MIPLAISNELSRINKDSKLIQHLDLHRCFEVLSAAINVDVFLFHTQHTYILIKSTLIIRNRVLYEFKNN